MYFENGVVNLFFKSRQGFLDKLPFAEAVNGQAGDVDGWFFAED